MCDKRGSMGRPIKKKTTAVLVLWLLIMLMFSGCDSGSKESSAGADTKAVPALMVECLSVGKADAFVLYTENSCVILDCGEKNDGKDIVNFLDSKGINKIDYLIISHFDKDHIGGAKKLINSKTIDKVYVTYRTKTTGKTEDFDEAIYGAGLESEEIRKETEFELDGIGYRIFPPLLESYGSDDDSNDSSLVVKVIAGEKSMLFAGDAENRRLSELIQNEDIKADILKVPHHGREETLSEMFIGHVNPAYAVITSSDEEKEDEGIMNILKAQKVKTFLTREGSVTIKIDKNEILITQEKSNE